MGPPLQSARELFVAAVRLPPEQWDSYLGEACTDPDLRRRVRDLLDAHREAGNFLETPGGSVEPVRAVVHEDPGTVIGPYRLLDQIGEGGMGTVWMAEQSEPVKRQVALKVITPGMDSREGVVARFEAERQALALMDHPNIAKVHDGGTTPGGRPYFVMELVQGIPITSYCDLRRLTPGERLELFLPVCQAVQHAHTKGIIHRDLKPSNVLVALYDGKPVPKVIDFGVAKAVGQRLTEKTLQTRSGSLVGTLEYMSPEQAELNNHDIDTRSDVYSLGVLLYELLTGSTPLERRRADEVGVLEALRLIREEEPPPPSTRLSTATELSRIAAARGVEPSKLSGLVRGELDWIVMKCLDKDRSRRYETADSLARDLERYLQDEPVQAGPPSAWYRFRKFARRNKAALLAAAAVGCVVLLALVGLAAGLVVLGRKQEATQKALLSEREALLSEKEALLSEKRSRYSYGITLADREWGANNPDKVRAILDDCPKEFRQWEWHYLKRLCHLDLLTFRGHGNQVASVAFSPDGLLVASADLDANVKVWDATSGKVMHTFREGYPNVMFGPDGRNLTATARFPVNSGDVPIQAKVWDLTTGEPLLALNQRLAGVRDVAFSPDGRRVATSGKSGATVRDAATGRELFTVGGPPHSAYKAVLSPDGRFLATAGVDQTVKVWEAATGKPVGTLAGHRHLFPMLAFSPDGRRFASASVDGTTRVWDVQTGQVTRTFSLHTESRCNLTFSPDGERLATAGVDGKVVNVWDLRTGEAVLTLRGHGSLVHQVAFSPDGLRLASASADRTVKVWDAMSPREALWLPIRRRSVVRIAFSPDGRRLASTAGDSKVDLWDVQTGKRVHELRPPAGVLRCVAFSPDGQSLASGCSDRMVRRWDLASGQERQPLRGHTHIVLAVAFSPDGRRLASGGADDKVLVWDVQTGEVVHTLQGHANSVEGVAFSPDGQRLASCSKDRTFRVWDVPSGQEVFAVGPQTVGVNGVAFSPDGRRLAAAFTDGRVQVVDAANGRECLAIRGTAVTGTSVAFSPDGRRLASAGGNPGRSSAREVILWDAVTGQEVLSLSAGRLVRGVAYSPDGHRLAAACDDGTIKVWDATPLPPQRE